MQVAELKSEKLKREYKITIPAKELADKRKAKLQNLAKRVKMDGFRPGKVPLDIVSKQYGDAVAAEVIEEVVKQSSLKAIEEKKIKPALQPKVDVLDYGEDKDLEFKMEVELMPEVPTLKLEDLKLEKFVTDIDDNHMQEGLERLASQAKSYSAVERSAKKGDRVIIDFEGFLNGEPFKGGKGEKFPLELGSNSFIPGFEEQIEGMNIGDERTIKVTFPQQYHSQELAGKDTEFKIKVHEVEESKASPIDDELAKRFGMKDLSELKENFKKQLEGDYSMLARNKLKKELFDVLEEKVAFDVPQGMLDQEFETIWRDVEHAKKEEPRLAKMSEKELKEEYQKIASRRVRLGILLADIGQKNNISVTNQEVMQAIAQQAKQFPGREKQVFEFYKSNPQATESVRGPILEEKVVDYILTKAATAEKKVKPDVWFENAELGHEGHVHGPDCNHDHDHDHDAKPKAKKKK